jgi:hypothetical protein
MDGKLWRRLYRIVRRLGDSKRGPRQQFADWEIVVWYWWSVLNDRPVTWLSGGYAAPRALRQRRRPSASTLSRRLRSASVLTLLGRLERRHRPASRAVLQVHRRQAAARGPREQGS